MDTNPGPAAKLIDWGYAVKLPLCDEVDRLSGMRGSVFSLSAFLNACYVIRRPGFVLCDAYLQVVGDMLKSD